MKLDVVSFVGAILTVIVLAVAVVAQIGRTRRKKKVDSQTQTSYTFVRTVSFGWKPPKVVPLTKWKLSSGTPEVWRLNTTDDPFYARPILTAGQVRPAEGTRDAEEFERIAQIVGGERNLVNGPPAGV